MLLAFLLISATLALVAFLVVIKLRFVTAEPNEWMLIIRNGTVIKSGVGISGFIAFGDKVVKFPSKINKVSFSAQQVTNEMQGVEVSGIIVWAIYRDADGPARAYKNLGEDLKSETPSSANSSLVEMANSIVRHRIANSNIEQIIKNRSKIREEVKKEMNAVVNGWGVWLETVEITDVKIMSGSLFTNLQTEFREEQRQKAELIRMRIENDLEEKRLVQQLNISKKRSDNETQQSIYELNQEVKVKEEQQNIYNKDQEIHHLRIESGQQLKLHKLEKENQYNLEEKRQRHLQKINELALEGITEKKNQELSSIREESHGKSQDAELARSTLRQQGDIQTMKTQLELRAEMNKDMPFEYHALNTIRDIFKSLPLSEVKVMNMHGQSEGSVGSLVANIVSAVKEM